MRLDKGEGEWKGGKKRMALFARKIVHRLMNIYGEEGNESGKGEKKEEGRHYLLAKS